MYAALGPKVFPHVGTNLLPNDAERKFARDMKAEMEIYEHLRNLENEFPVCVSGLVHALRNSTPTYDEAKGTVLTLASNGDQEYCRSDQPALSLTALLVTLAVDCVIVGNNDTSALLYIGKKVIDYANPTGLWFQFINGSGFNRLDRFDALTCWKRCNDHSASASPLLWIKRTDVGFESIILPTNFNAWHTSSTIMQLITPNRFQLTTMHCSGKPSAEMETADASRSTCYDETGTTRGSQSTAVEPTILDSIFMTGNEDYEFGGDSVAPIGEAKVLATLSNLRRTSAQILARNDALPRPDLLHELFNTCPIENGDIPNSCFVIATLAAVTQQLPTSEFTRHPMMTSVLRYVKDFVGNANGLLTMKQQLSVSQLIGVGCVIVDPAKK